MEDTDCGESFLKIYKSEYRVACFLDFNLLDNPPWYALRITVLQLLRDSSNMLVP